MKRNPALDGIRALAVMAVMAFHCRVPGLEGGFYGVDIFFVLSGFLITTILTREMEETGTIDLRRFYLRRLLRLAPALFAMLVAYLVAGPMMFPTVETTAHWRDAAISAAYLSDYAVAFWHVPIVISHMWSLAVEEHYYLLWPMVLLLILRCTGWLRVAMLIALYALATFWRAHVLATSGDWIETYYRFDTRLTGLLLGGLLAFLPRPARVSGDTVSLIALAVLMATAGVLRWGYNVSLTWGMPIIELLAAVIIWAVVRDPFCATARLLSLRPVAFVGLISYAIYLWHYPMAVFFRTHVAWPLSFVATTALSLMFATASYFLIEKPIGEWRKRIGASANPRQMAPPGTQRTAGS